MRVQALLPSRWWSSRRTHADGRNAAVLAFSAGLAALALAGYWFAVWREHRVPESFAIPWLVFVVAFAVSDNFAIHVEFGDNAHSYNLNELPLVVGLFCCDPRLLVVARVVATFGVLALLQRQRLAKLTFNVAYAALESVAVVGLFLLARDVAGNHLAAMWLVAIGATSLMTALQVPAIMTAVRLSGGRPEPVEAARTAMFGMVQSAATASLGVAAVALLSAEAVAGSIVMAVIAVVLFSAYRGYAVISQRYANLEKLYAFTKQLARSPEFDAAMSITLHEACEVLRAERGELCLLDEVGNGNATSVRVTYVDGDIDISVPGSIELDWVRERVVAQGQGLVIARNTRNASERQYLIDHSLFDFAVVPLRDGDAIIGTLAVSNRRGEVSTFDDDDLKAFETLANHASVSLENGRLIDRLRNEVADKQHQALHDPLTDLGNRNLLTARADEALAARRRGAGQLAVLLMDLNRFKDVNDTLGHQKGDALLRGVAARLRSHAPANATITRLGGDEFAILLPQIHDVHEAVTVAFALNGAMHAPFVIDDLQLTIDGAIGVAVAPDHGDDTAALLQHADIAMYQAKDAHDTGVALYDSAQNQHSQRRLTLATDLRTAVEAETLAVHYQPKTDLPTGKVVGVEALLRWDHEKYGAVPPDEFIPIAESTGLMRPLTRLVLNRSLQQLRDWHRIGLELHVSVNLSARSLMSTDIADDIERALHAADVPAHALTLEITETQVMADQSRTIAILDRLNRLGVQISIDDFGTGYSSLSYLQSLPVDELKIDKSFVLHMMTVDANAKIVQSIIHLGHNLGLRVVAEGIEDAATCEALTELGCDVGQGYYLSRPVPTDRLTPWLLTRCRPETAHPSSPAASALRVVS